MTDLSSTLDVEAADDLAALSRANQAQLARYPGDRATRQAVHTVYGGAHLFKAETSRKLGELALGALDRYAPDARSFGAALRLPGHDDPGATLPRVVHERVIEKLRREAVEDFRIDFEDGFGVRPDAEEDEHAVRAAREVARGMKEGILPPFLGIRIKTFTEELVHRAVRTLDLFVTTLVTETGGALPENFVVTLPKITVPEQPRTLVRLFERLENRLSLAPGALRMEMMVELTQSIIDAEGRCGLRPMLAACEGRCVAAHFGTYDYTASCDITAAYQSMDHAACQFALHVMKNALAGTGVFLSDGATNVMPVPVHKGASLTAEQERANAESVHAAWRLMVGHVQGSLRNGIYQGWDLHPAQLPVRYAACYAFFLEGFAPAAERLRNFIDKAAQATLVGDVFDDAATGQGLLNYFLRGLSSGAVTLEELGKTGLTPEEVRTRSFVKILAGRTARARAGG